MASGPSRIIQVRVKPGARVSDFQQAETGTWSAQLIAQPVDGKANAELIGLVAKHFGVPKSSVEIRSGTSGRTKLVRIDGIQA